MTAKRLIVFTLLLCFILLFGSLAYAQETGVDTPFPGFEEVGTSPEDEIAGEAIPLVSTWDFVRMLLILGAVIGVIYLLFFLLKRTASRKVAENDLISVLGSKTLAGNKALHLIQVGGSIYLIGSSENGVSLISEISEKESLDRLRLQTTELEHTANRKSFREALYEMFRPQGNSLYTEDTVNFMKVQKERLQKMR